MSNCTIILEIIKKNRMFIKSKFNLNVFCINNRINLIKKAI